MPRLIVALAALASASATSSQSLDFSTVLAASGSWNYASTSTGSAASFMDSTGISRITIQCTRASRQVTISRASAVAAGAMTVWTTSAQRSVPARYEPATLRLSADLAASDTLLDAIAFSRGRFALAVTGTSTQVVPAWPEIARVIEDCRA